jgi:hypothetical protein
LPSQSPFDSVVAKAQQHLQVTHHAPHAAAKDMQVLHKYEPQALLQRGEQPVAVCGERSSTTSACARGQGARARRAGHAGLQRRRRRRQTAKCRLRGIRHPAAASGSRA